MGVRDRKWSPVLLGVLLCICYAAQPAAAGQATSLNIEQAWNQGDEIRVYFSASDLGGSPVTGLKPEDLQARLGGIDTPVLQLERFSPQSEGIAWVVLLDVSRSLDSSQFEDIRSAVRSLMSQMGPRDNMALMTFGSDVRVVCDYSSDQSALGSRLDSLTAEDENTQMYQGLLQALDVARRQDSSLPVRRSIVILSDGSEDYYGGVSKDEVITSLKIDPVPVYALGIYNERVNSDAALESMGEIARTSGGRIWQCEAAALNSSVSALIQEVQSNYVADLDSSRCPQDGKDYRLVLALEQSQVRVEDGVSLYMSAAPPQAKEEEKGSPVEWAGIPDPRDIQSWDDLWTLPLWILTLAGGLVLILICFIIMMIAKKRKRSAKNGAAAPLYSDNEHTGDYDIYALPVIGPYDSTHQDGFPGAAAANSGSGGGSLAPIRDGTALRLNDNAPQAAAGAGLAHDRQSGWFAPPGQKTGILGDLPPAEADAGQAANRVKVIVLSMLGKGPGERKFQLAFSGEKSVLTIGRKADNDLALTGDDRISARHCQLILDNGRVYVKDLESTNGTLVNGVPITGRYVLEQDDLILIGKTELRYALIQDNGGPEQ